MKSNPYLIPYTKINMKWVKNLNIIAKIIELLEESIREKLHSVGFSNDISDVIPKAQATKEKN
jgi:hypothetical protein